MSRLVLATRNPGKLRELQAMVDSLDLDVVSVAEFPDVDDVVESGVTFEQNATLKAREVAVATNLPAVADDSGLSVDVLGGCPGVFSARWSGSHGADDANIDLLLAQTGDVPAELLTAQFVCCVALATPDGNVVLRRGELAGRLVRERRGQNGFGYDPIFELPDGRTLAELGAEQKNQISHRARAFAALLPDLRQLG